MHNRYPLGHEATMETLVQSLLLGDEESIDIREIVRQEGTEFSKILISYGLTGDLANQVDNRVHDDLSFSVIISDTDIAGEEIFAGIESCYDSNREKTSTFISPAAVTTYVSDVFHSVEPVGGLEDQVFCRNAAIKMVYQSAFTLGVLSDFLRNTRGSSAEEAIAAIGSADFEEVDAGLYAELMPYRAASRVALDRLQHLASDFFDESPEHGHDIAEEYIMHRKRAINAIVHASYQKMGLIDVASVSPLSHQDMYLLMDALNETASGGRHLRALE